ncbi:hypothetical protein ESCOCP320M_18115 [Escherichia coli]
MILIFMELLLQERQVVWSWKTRTGAEFIRLL